MRAPTNTYILRNTLNYYSAVMNYQFSKMQKARKNKRISYRPSSGSYSLGAGHSGASRLEKTGLRAVLLEKEFKDNDGDVEYLYDQQDGAWGGPSRHVTIREEGDPEKIPQDLDSVRVIPPNEECTHCADDTGRVESESLMFSKFPAYSIKCTTY